MRSCEAAGVMVTRPGGEPRTAWGVLTTAYFSGFWLRFRGPDDTNLATGSKSSTIRSEIKYIMLWVKTKNVLLNPFLSAI